MKTNTPLNTVRLTPRGSEILLTLAKRHPGCPRTKLIEMALEQFVTSQAELTDAELNETAMLSEILAAKAGVLETRGPDSPKAGETARQMRTIVVLLGRILARAIRLKALRKETKP